jgi:hypothetical protein
MTETRTPTAGTSGRAPRRFDRLALLGLSLIVACVIGEVAIRTTRLDHRFLTDTFMYMRLDASVHRESPDWFLHFEPTPGASGQFVEPGRPPYEVHIDAFGARYPTHPGEKAPRTFRILCVGGSTTYGAAVSDEDTFPAALERRLNAGASSGIRFEAWNYGVHAYVLSQAAHRARKELAARDPDLILVQLHNVGPRCFSLGADEDPRDTIPRYADDPYLVPEYFPPPHWLAPGLHFTLLRHSAIYRALTGLRLRSKRLHDDLKTFAFAEDLSLREAQALLGEADARGVPVLFFSLPCDGPGPPSGDAAGGRLPADRVTSLYVPGRGPEYYEIHPPPNGLDQFAERLVEVLHERGLLPGTKH